MQLSHKTNILIQQSKEQKMARQRRRGSYTTRWTRRRQGKQHMFKLSDRPSTATPIKCVSSTLGCISVYIETGACLTIFYKVINISCSEHEVITLSRPCRLMSLYLSRFQLLLSLHRLELILNKQLHTDWLSINIHICNRQKMC